MIFLSILIYAVQKPFSSHHQPQLPLHRPMIKEQVLTRLTIQSKLIYSQAQIKHVQSKPSILLLTRLEHSIQEAKYH
jgi:hypothetical protein